MAKTIGGTVKRCDKESGWCLIDGDDGAEYTGNIMIKGEICGSLSTGERVRFEPVEDIGFLGPAAINIRKIS